MILLDTSGLLSAIDGAQRHHGECAAALTRASPPLLLSPFVLAELDYLLARHVGTGAQTALLDEVARDHEVIVVTKRGKPVARLTPVTDVERDLRRELRGSIVKETDLVSPIKTPWEAAS